MLTLLTQEKFESCEKVRRREFLRVGTLGLGGLSLSTLLALRASGADVTNAVKDKSIVLLFLTGGPSQIETFDPKMTAPVESRSVTGEVKTSLPGVTFGGTFENLSRWAHRMAVVRSFTHGNSNHTGAVQDVIRGGNSTGAGIGSVVSRIRGTTHTNTGMPTQIYLAHDEDDPQYDKERLRLLEAAGPGELGASYSPFEPSGDGQVNRNMTLNIPKARLDDRRSLRKALDTISRRVDANGVMQGLDKFEQQAFDLILGKSKQAFDLSQEDPRLLRRYDTSRFNTALRVSHRPSTLGHQLLLARRLCEAGCGFITIHNPGWDMHGGETQFNMPVGMQKLGRPLDRAVATFLEDIDNRGLSDKILLIITGEFGRTPKVKPNGGRDHWPKLSTLAFCGGGLRMGQTVGLSNSTAGAPRSRPVTLENLFATVLHVLFDVPALRLRNNLPRQIASVLERGIPIPELV
jgi:hypothetical protein